MSILVISQHFNWINYEFFLGFFSIKFLFYTSFFNRVEFVSKFKTLDWEMEAEEDLFVPTQKKHQSSWTLALIDEVASQAPKARQMSI
jgi:hypothetical protein